MNHLDEKGLHIGDDGRRQFGTVLGFVLRNTRTRDHDDKGCNFDFSKEVTKATIAALGRLTPQAGLAILDNTQEALGSFINSDDNWSTEAQLKRNYAFLADYVKQWLEGGLASVGRQVKGMWLEELFSLLNENPLRLKWLAPEIFANRDIMVAEAHTLRWVVRNRDRKIDIEATIDGIQHAGHGTYDPSNWEVRKKNWHSTTLEEHLGYLPRPVLDPFTGKAWNRDDKLPYDMLPEVRSKVVQWATAAQHPGIQALRDQPELLFHPPKSPPAAYARLEEDFNTAPEHDRQLFSRFGPDAIIAGHPAYPAPGPYLRIH